MNIITKYNVGDEVFTIDNDEIVKLPVESIDVKMTKGYTRIEYTLLIREGSGMDEKKVVIRGEESCFSTLRKMYENSEHYVDDADLLFLNNV